MRSGFLRRALVALTALCSLNAAATGSESLPAGFRIDGCELVWSGSETLRMGGARYEIRSKGRLLGYALQRGDTLRLRRCDRQRACVA